MAYASTVTVTRTTVAGRRQFVVSVTETECSTTDEWNTSTSTGAVSGVTYTLPIVGRIVSWKVNKTAGSASTVAPVLAKATGITAAGVSSIAVQGAAAAINSVTEIPYRLTNGVLYCRSTPDSGSNNSITTEIVIVAGGQ